MNNIDLTAPSTDLGTQLIIEATTDADERFRVATDPTVVAIAVRAAELTDEQWQKISDAYARNFNTHRVTHTRLHHRVRKHGGPNSLTTRSVYEQIHRLFSCPRYRDRDYDRCQPYHTCGTTFFASAVNDAIFAHLARTYLTDDEIRVFASPFVDVAGQVAAPAAARFDGAEINARWGNGWPTDPADDTNPGHEFSPVLGAAIANELGHPWYLEAGSPGGDFVTWLDVPNGGRIGVSPFQRIGEDNLMRWYIAVYNSAGDPIHIDHELPVSDPVTAAAGRARRIAVKHLTSQAQS